MRFLPLVMVALGESLAVIAEMLGAREYSKQANFLPTFSKLLLLFVVSGCLLIGGYALGYSNFKKNIWVITAISLTSFIIVEPLIAVILFKETPTIGAYIGLGLGFVGLCAALLF